MTAPRVILVSNDIVPGSGLPVAAPGLRVHGLAAGLRGRGYPVTTVMVRGPLDRQWRAPIPPPSDRSVVPLSAERLGDYLRTHAPAVVVLTNANQIDRLNDHDGNRYVIDFFAPKALELAYESGPGEPYPVEALAELRERKLRAIDRADGFIVNGRKKLPYFLGWILQTGRDVRTLPYEHVGMCLPAAFAEQPEAAPTAEPVRFAIAGYLQGWSVPGAWLRALATHLSAGKCELDAIMPEHWGGASGFANPELDRLVEHNRIKLTDAMTFADFQAFLRRCHVVLDLFNRTRERELAVVTRTIVALSCGKPVVHPPFTEVSPLILEYDAGWLVDPADEDRVAAVLRDVVENPSQVAAKAEGARALWREQLDPDLAIEGLVRVIEQITTAVASGGVAERLQ
jgi:hypothetical protein